MKKQFLILVLTLCSTITFSQMKVLSDGKVGIGTSSPSDKLHVSGGNIRLESGYELFFTDNGQIRSVDNNHRILFRRSENKFEIREYGDIVFSSGATSGTETAKMVLKNNGYLGIGTSSPNNLLQVAGLISFNDTYYNTFLGSSSGAANSTGTSNTFTGYQSGYSNTTGYYNTFIGRNAGGLNVSAFHNTFLGYYAGSKTTGSSNTAVGSWAGNNCTSGVANTFMGQQTGWGNTTGGGNTCIGYHAGWENTTGNYNTLIGYGAGFSGGTTYSNSTAIGYNAYATGSNYIKIGNGSVTTIGGAVSWSVLSDGRFKMNVTENVKGLEFINKLRPVTYQMNTHEYDAFIRQNIPQSTDTSSNDILNIPVDYSASMSVVHSGFIAQEVDSVAQLCGFSSSIVHTPANSTDPYALSYAEFVVPLVKAVQELNAIITEQDQQIQALVTQIEEQREQINTIETDLAHCCAAAPTDKMMGMNTNSNTQSAEAKLYQNVPNPFDEKTTIRYIIPENSGSSSILVFDMQGKLVKTYPVSVKGDGNIEINANELQPGMYMYSLITGGKEIDTKKMILTE